MDSSDWIIQTHQLSKTYCGKAALNGIDLKVAPPSIFGFLGPNGAGKTTTIKLLLGLIHPSGGSASIFGLDSVRDSVAIRSRIGYLPQDPRFYEYMSARQILDYTAHFFFKGPQKEINARLAETMGRRDVLEVMDRLRKYTTIFYCTHILDDEQRVSDTVAILNRGKLVAKGSIESLLAGSEGATYEVHLNGGPINRQRSVSAQAWVKEVQTRTINNTTPSIAMTLMSGASVPSYLPLFVALGASLLCVLAALRIIQKQEL
jgi:ABC-2 type transport system ATP-binding protein